MSEHICACSEPEGDQCIRTSGTVTKTDWQNIIVILLLSCSTYSYSNLMLELWIYKIFMLVCVF